MMLTRMMAPDHYGLYAIVISVMILLALPFAGGFSVFIIRHASAAMATNRLDLFRGLIQKSFIWVLGGSVTLSIATYYLIPFIVPDYALIYRIGLGLVVFSPLLLFSGSVLRALRHVLLGRFPEFFIQPALLAGILFLFFVSGVETLYPDNVLGIHVGSYAVALSISLCILSFFLPKDFWKTKASCETKKWVKSALPLMLAVGLVIVNSNIDIVMVGALAGETEAGQYRVASRLAGFVLFFLFASNNAIGPVISGLHAKGEKVELQKTLTAIARLTFLCTLPVAILLWIWPNDILTLLFGSAFAAGSMALVILVCANFFSVSMGQVGHVMSLVGQEKYTAYAALIAMVINVVLNAALIPQYGLNGAAIATGTSIVAWNAILAIWTAKKAGYYCTILGPMGKGPAK